MNMAVWLNARHVLLNDENIDALVFKRLSRKNLGVRSVCRIDIFAFDE